MTSGREIFTWKIQIQFNWIFLSCETRKLFFFLLNDDDELLEIDGLVGGSSDDGMRIEEMGTDDATVK